MNPLPLDCREETRVTLPDESTAVSLARLEGLVTALTTKVDLSLSGQTHRLNRVEQLVDELVRSRQEDRDRAARETSAVRVALEQRLEEHTEDERAHPSTALAREVRDLRTAIDQARGAVKVWASLAAVAGTAVGATVSAVVVRSLTT